MPADIIQTQYEKMESIAAKFEKVAEENREMERRIKTRVEQLLKEGWIGLGSDRFEAEMHNQVLPALSRMTKALAESGRVSRKISQILKEAEEEAAEPFRNGRVPYPVRGPALVSEDGLMRIKGFEPITNPVLFMLGGEVKYHGIFFPDKDEVDTNDIGQGDVGNCYFAASLAAVVNQNPDLIRNLIKDNKDGTYTVKLYNLDSAGFEIEQYTVNAELPITEVYDKKSKKWVEAHPYMNQADAANKQQEIWPHILEKAFAKKLGYWNEGQGYLEMDKGGFPHEAMMAITGKPSYRSLPDEFSLKELAQKQREGYAMTLSSKPGENYEEYRHGTLVKGHAYWIEHIDEKSGTVTIRNPWGYNNSKQNRIVMKYSELDKNFDWISMGKTK